MDLSIWSRIRSYVSTYSLHGTNTEFNFTSFLVIRNAGLYVVDILYSSSHSCLVVECRVISFAYVASGGMDFSI